jgi:hypothetical protein
MTMEVIAKCKVIIYSLPYAQGVQALQVVPGLGYLPSQLVGGYRPAAAKKQPHSSR